MVRLCQTLGGGRQQWEAAGIGMRFGRRLELIVTRITLLALFFVSVVGFTLDHARINLLLMSASALAIVLWNGLWRP